MRPLIAVCMLAIAPIVAEEVSIHFTGPSDPRSPSATALITVDGREHVMESTCTGAVGLVAKDGRFVVYSFRFDGNGDGLLTSGSEDGDRLRVMQVTDGGLREVHSDVLVGGVDLSSENSHLVYGRPLADGVQLVDHDLESGAERILVERAARIAEPVIRLDDRQLAVLVRMPGKQQHDQVILFPAQGTAAVITTGAGSRGGLAWDGQHLRFTDQGQDLAYDPERAAFVEARSIRRAAMVDKRRSGWPVR
jgi:hypothetical protein